MAGHVSGFLDRQYLISSRDAAGGSRRAGVVEWL
jgi:hypothetical protein